MKKCANFFNVYAVFIITLFLIISTTSAFAANDESTWGLELSGRYNGTTFDMSDASDGIDANIEDEGLQITKKYDAFPAGTQMDFSLSVRYTRFLLGVQYSLVSETDGGYEYGIPGYDPFSYKVSAESRDFHIMFGYIQPLYKRLDLVAYFMYGSASVEAHIRDEELMSSNSQYWDLDKDFGSMRMEGRLRVNLRENIAIDFIGGYRMANAENMGGDVRNGNQQTPSNATFTDYGFDLTGPYYGVGITLKHSYDN